MKKALAVLAVALVAAGVWAARKKWSVKPPPPADRVTAQLGPIEESIEATGSVLPYHRVEIKPMMTGRIEKLMLEEGDKVAQGQIIAWMSSTDRAAILDGARAQGPEMLKKWEDTYKATPVIAPLPGVIILKNVVEGQTVDASVVVYAMSDELIVVAQVDESDVGKIRLGMPARVVLDSYPDRVEKGKVFDILNEGKNVSNVIQYSVKIRLDRVPDYYRSQMSANISFIVRRKDKALLVPAAAVSDKGGVKRVRAPGPDDAEVWKTVKTGLETDASIEIVAGLSAGDVVLVSQAKYVPQPEPQASPLSMGAFKKSDAGARKTH
ncbi:MAG: HlyD family efflux transporter periplasmic adaptor subunit [Elusimicrobia bacterium]|nr:HlyD family efflux transporter periplasmic adaptor subunit [Elusimicrobiota bacterium]